MLVGIRLQLRERLCMKLYFIGMLSCSRTLCRHFPCSKNEVKNLELLKKVRDTVFYNLEQGTCWIIRFYISIQKWTRIPDRLLAHIHIPPLPHRLESLKAKERKLLAFSLWKVYISLPHCFELFHHGHKKPHQAQTERRIVSSRPTRPRRRLGNVI